MISHLEKPTKSQPWEGQFGSCQNTEMSTGHKKRASARRGYLAHLCCTDCRVSKCGREQRQRVEFRAAGCGGGLWRGERQGQKMKKACGRITADHLVDPAQWCSNFCLHQHHRGACQMHISQAQSTEVRSSRY